MAIRDLAGLIEDARLWAQDDSTAGNALSTAQWTSIANEVEQAFASAFPEHFVIRADSKSVTFTSGVGSWTPTTSTVNVRRVLAMRIGTTNLERMEPHRIYELQSFDSAAGTPTRYALIPDNSSATMTTKPNTFTILLHPIPVDGAQTILSDYEFYPIDMSSSSTSDLPRGFGDAESRWFGLLMAARGAWLNGKSLEFINGILAGVPEEVQTRMHVREGLLAPRQRPQESVI